MSIRKGIQDIILWRGLNFLSVLVLNVLLARVFEAAGAGSVFFIINNLSLLILVLSFSLEAGLGYYAATGKIENVQAGLLALVWCLVMSSISFCIFSFYNLSLPIGLNLKFPAVFFIAGNLLISFYSALYFAKENFFLPNFLLLIINLLLIVLFIPPLNERITQRELLYAYFAGFLVQGILITVFYFSKSNRGTYKFPVIADLKLVMKYSGAAFLGNIIFFLVYRIDYWFVETWCSAADLGNYIQVSKIVQWFLVIPSMIGTVIFPLTAIGKNTMMVEKVALSSRMLLGLFSIICLGLSITGFWIFPFIFGDTYSAMYPVFLLYIPGILALVSLYPVSSYHAGINRLDINIKGCLLALLVIITGNWLFTPSYGIYAASIASSVGYIVYFIYSLHNFNKRNKIKLSRFFKPLSGDYTFLKTMLYKRK